MEKYHEGAWSSVFEERVRFHRLRLWSLSREGLEAASNFFASRSNQWSCNQFSGPVAWQTTGFGISMATSMATRAVVPAVTNGPGIRSSSAAAGGAAESSAAAMVASVRPRSSSLRSGFLGCKVQVGVVANVAAAGVGKKRVANAGRARAASEVGCI